MSNPYPHDTLWWYIHEEQERVKRAAVAERAAARSAPRNAPEIRRYLVERERRRRNAEMFARAIKVRTH